MRLAYVQAENTTPDWREALYVAFEFEFPSAFNIEWLIDKADSNKRGGLW